MDQPRDINDGVPFVMERQPGVASRTETELPRMHFQDCCGVTHQDSYKIVTKNGHRDFAVQILRSQAAKFAHPHAGFIRPDIDLHIPPQTVQFRDVLGSETLIYHRLIVLVLNELVLERPSWIEYEYRPAG